MTMNKMIALFAVVGTALSMTGCMSDQNAATVEQADKSGTYMMIHEKVANFDKWKAHFFAHHEEMSHQDMGMQLESVYHGMDKPNDVYLVMKITDMNKVKEHMKSPDLKKSMKEAGVKGKPDAFMLNRLF
jgi:hypothetical protein